MPGDYTERSAVQMMARELVLDVDQLTGRGDTRASYGSNPGFKSADDLYEELFAPSLSSGTNLAAGSSTCGRRLGAKRSLDRYA